MSSHYLNKSLLAKGQVESQPAFAGFLVLVAHVLAGLGHGLDRRIKINPVPGGNLVGRDRECNPRLHRAESATFDAGHLHVTCDGIAGHAQMMLECRLGSVFEYVGRTAHRPGR